MRSKGAGSPAACLFECQPLTTASAQLPPGTLDARCPQLACTVGTLALGPVSMFKRRGIRRGIWHHPEATRTKSGQ
eukprot:3622715-Pyramimonas_sp.AAC.1